MKKQNNTLKEIGQVLLGANSVLIYPHVNMDGDALGSAVAICKALRSRGKTCYILVEDKIPKNLQFLDNGYCTYDQGLIQSPDISLCVDCGDVSRFPKRKDKFEEGKVSVCIDHHETSSHFCDYNHIVPKAAATGELIFQLLQAMDCTGDKEIGEALFAAITTDTGNFQYSNTTKSSHEIVAQLYDWDIDTRKVSVEIYDNMRLERLLLKNRAMETLEMLCDGKAAIAYVDQQMLRETGAEMDESEGFVDQLRSIEGVEFAIFVKEDSEAVTRASLRAKSWGNVADIAKRLGGGGHIKAAGCTIHMPIKEALPLIRKEVEQHVEAAEAK